MTRVVLLHGAATTARIWDRLLPFLAGLRDVEVEALERPRTGELQAELNWLAPRAEGAFIVGMSGGATLGLALMSADVRTAGALLHEPAAGSFGPDLLAPFASAFDRGGRAAFGRSLYGPSWRPEMAGDIPESVTLAELRMFRGFEPAMPCGTPSSGVVITAGGRSNPIRHQVREALHRRFGYGSRAIAGVGHFAAHDAPKAFAHAIGEELRRTTRAANES